MVPPERPTLIGAPDYNYTGTAAYNSGPTTSSDGYPATRYAASGYPAAAYVANPGPYMHRYPPAAYSRGGYGGYSGYGGPRFEEDEEPLFG